MYPARTRPYTGWCKQRKKYAFKCLSAQPLKKGGAGKEGEGFYDCDHSDFLIYITFFLHERPWKRVEHRPKTLYMKFYNEKKNISAVRKAIGFSDSTVVRA
jgi:hypothetical protein